MFDLSLVFMNNCFAVCSLFDALDFLKLVLLHIAPIFSLSSDNPFCCRVSTTPFRGFQLLGFDCRVGGSARASGPPEEATQLSLTGMEELRHELPEV